MTTSPLSPLGVVISCLDDHSGLLMAPRPPASFSLNPQPPSFQEPSDQRVGHSASTQGSRVWPQLSTQRPVQLSSPERPPPARVPDGAHAGRLTPPPPPPAGHGRVTPSRKPPRGDPSPNDTGSNLSPAFTETSPKAKEWALRCSWGKGPR